MISQELLEILRCPQTHQPVSEASQDLIARVNAAIAAQSLRNNAGDTQRHAVQAGLVRQDRRVLFPIVDGIPIMLADEAIPLDGLVG